MTMNPARIENTAHHFGYGVIPLANAQICTAAVRKKKTANRTAAGSKKHKANFTAPSAELAGSSV